MSLYQSPFVSSPQTSFTPLFRFLEDFENYSAPTRGSRAPIKHFQPKFDVTEQEQAYELHGELPGIDQKDVEIEFTDRQTLTVRGRTERTYTSGTPPEAVEGSKTAGKIESGNGHKATVEDADENESNSNNQVSKKSTNTEVAKQDEAPRAKYWVSERSVGQFSRSFSFPESVDQDAVKASMKNGILSIIVPKAKKHESRKIAISS